MPEVWREERVSRETVYDLFQKRVGGKERQMMNGKGDKPRRVNRQRYEKNHKRVGWASKKHKQYDRRKPIEREHNASQDTA